MIGRLAAVAVLIVAAGAALALALGSTPKSKSSGAAHGAGGSGGAGTSTLASVAGPPPGGSVAPQANSENAPDAGYGAEPPTPAAGHVTVHVDMRRIQFLPTVTHLRVGDAVDWSNTDNVAHNVTADSSLVSSQTGPFISPVLKPGSHYARRFVHPGTYSYLCTIHPTMVGVLDVR
ncbi:MAG: cupredoxin domain-containing protein [Solirubrobacteraceae bacterium]|nr:MAG: hypothetical protein DLM63_11330 [Solirubrobacterales bacterium]